MKPEALFLAHRIPYPPDKGDKIRSWRLLQRLTNRFRIHLACFVDNPSDFSHQRFLEDVCESVTLIPLDPGMAKLRSVRGFATGSPLSFSYYQDQRMMAAVDAIRQRPLTAEIAFSSTMAPYIETPVLQRKRIVDFCDADSEKWRQYAEDAGGPMRFVYGREARQLAQAETTIANWADASFAVSPDEADIFNQRTGLQRKVDWFSNGVDTNEFNPASFPLDNRCRSDVAFVGAMDYHANVEGVLSFHTHVWPKIRAASPNARFAIVGANPVEKILRLQNQDGVHVTGRVDDVRPWLAGAAVVIAPLRVARGLQNKVLEALSMGKALVASSGAVTGINPPDGAVFVADDPDDTATKILELLAYEQQRAMMGAAARAFVESSFTWNAGLARLDAAMDRLGL